LHGHITTDHGKLLADSGSVRALCGGGQGEGLYMEMKSLFLTRWAVLIPNRKRIIDRIFFCNLAKFKIKTIKCFKSLEILCGFIL
jgi:hypothetical protein